MTSKLAPILIGGKVKLDADGIDFTKTYTFQVKTADGNTYEWTGVRPNGPLDGLAIFNLPGMPVLKAKTGLALKYTAPRPTGQSGCYCDLDADECARRGHPNRSAG